MWVVYGGSPIPLKTPTFYILTQILDSMNIDAVRYENTGRINFTNFVNGTQGDELIVVSSRNDITEVICYE